LPSSASLSRRVIEVRTVELEYALAGGRLKERKGMPEDLQAEMVWYQREAENERRLRQAEEQAKAAHEETLERSQ
jgi:hypothetical protein